MSSITSNDAVALTQLDDATKADIARWAETEASKAKVRSAIHSFTDLCFKKCVTSAATDSLSANESSCVENCIGRFLDTNTSIVKMIADQLH